MPKIKEVSEGIMISYLVIGSHGMVRIKPTRVSTITL